jgi:hypothetical protein
MKEKLRCSSVILSQHVGINGYLFIPDGVIHGWKTFDVPARLLDVQRNKGYYEWGIMLIHI